MLGSVEILIIAILLIAVYVVYLYNRLIRYKNIVKEAWADIEVQLKRRFNLIPNLVESVKGYMIHEKELLEKITKLRNQALSAQNQAELEQADNMLTSALKSLFAVAENYPDLKANQNFLELQRELTNTEDKIQAARRFYNSSVMQYNSYLEMFPSNIIAKMFNFKPAEFFEIENEKEKEVVKVDFSKKENNQNQNESKQ